MFNFRLLSKIETEQKSSLNADNIRGSYFTILIQVRYLALDLLYIPTRYYINYDSFSHKASVNIVLVIVVFSYVSF